MGGREREAGGESERDRAGERARERVRRKGASKTHSGEARRDSMRGEQARLQYQHIGVSKARLQSQQTAGTSNASWVRTLTVAARHSCGTSRGPQGARARGHRPLPLPGSLSCDGMRFTSDGMHCSGLLVPYLQHACARARALFRLRGRKTGRSRPLSTTLRSNKGRYSA